MVSRVVPYLTFSPFISFFSVYIRFLRFFPLVFSVFSVFWKCSDPASFNDSNLRQRIASVHLFPSLWSQGWCRIFHFICFSLFFPFSPFSFLFFPLSPFSPLSGNSLTPRALMTQISDGASQARVYSFSVVSRVVPYLSLAPHTSGPRDVPRCGALSLLHKDAALQGGSSRNRC